MNSPMRALLHVLDLETDCYRKMQHLLIEEEAAMSLSSQSAFESVEVKKEALVERLQDYEKQRQALVDDVAQGLAVGEPKPSVTRLARVLPAADRDRLLQRARLLRALMTQVQLKNRHNQQLIDHYLGLIKGSLQLLTQGIDDHSVYYKPGDRHCTAGYRSNGGWMVRGNV